MKSPIHHATAGPSAIIQSLRLLPYQAAFAAHKGRFKIGLWARQTGKDHTATAEAVIDCLYNPGTTWIIVAASERQALESLSKARDWAEILKFPIAEYSESPSNLPLAVARSTCTEIKWSNASRLLALPSNPETIRGYSGNLILTEFAFNENADTVWRAIYPSISNPLRGGLKKVRIISTPNGLTNKFANLWLGIDSRRSRSDLHSPDLYHRSKITIHDAIARGLPLDAAELRAGLNDDDAWSQEYLCEFMDSSSVMFPYDLIAPCESETATESTSLPTGHSPLLYAGIDFGRKHHLTVCWILEAISTPNLDPNPTLFGNPHSTIRNSQLFVTREVLTLKNTSTPEQLEIMRPRLQRCRKICLDYTGAGVGFGDYVVKAFGPSKVELCPFTTALKSELFPRLRAALEQRILRIPISRDIREDLHAVQRTVTQSGQITYRAPQSADGHSDRTTALALALRAAHSAPVSACATTIFVPGRSADLRWANRPRNWGSRQRLCI